MITEVILNIFWVIADGICSLIPSWTMPAALDPAQLAAYATELRDWLHPVAYWIPFDIAFGVASIVLTLKLGVKLFQLAIFLRRVLLP